jgi:hypothetical protein
MPRAYKLRQRAGSLGTPTVILMVILRRGISPRFAAKAEQKSTIKP